MMFDGDNNQPDRVIKPKLIKLKKKTTLAEKIMWYTEKKNYINFHLLIFLVLFLYQNIYFYGVHMPLAV